MRQDEGDMPRISNSFDDHPARISKKNRKENFILILLCMIKNKYFNKECPLVNFKRYIQKPYLGNQSFYCAQTQFKKQ